MNDPIVDEIRRIRDEHAAKFNYDLEAIYRDLKEQERKSGRKFVNGIAYPEQPLEDGQLPIVTPPLKPFPSDAPSQPAG